MENVNAIILDQLKLTIGELEELKEKYDDLVEKTEEIWKTGCVNDYACILKSGFIVNPKTRDIVSAVAWEQKYSSEYYLGYEYISILDDSTTYKTISENDAFEGCDENDEDYLHYLATGEINQIMFDSMDIVEFKSFDCVVGEILKMLA